MNPDRIIALLSGFPAKVHAQVITLSEAESLWRPAPEEWNIKEVVCHLRDSAERLGERLRLITTQDNPLLPAFNENALVTEKRYAEEILPVVLMRYVEFRQRDIDLLRGLPAEGWGRTGVHQERGPQRFQQIAETIVRHETEHLEQIRELRASARASA